MNAIATFFNTGRFPSVFSRIGGLATILALAFLGGCTVYPATPTVAADGPLGSVYVNSVPPEPLYESVSVSPGVGFVWIPGYWNWGGVRYVWTAGRWVRPPQGYNHWLPGVWQHTHRGYRWVNGRWSNASNLPPLRPNVRPDYPRPNGSFPKYPDVKPGNRYPGRNNYPHSSVKPGNQQYGSQSPYAVDIKPDNRNRGGNSLRHQHVMKWDQYPSDNMRRNYPQRQDRWQR